MEQKQFNDRWKDTTDILKLDNTDWLNNWDIFKETIGNIIDSVFSLDIISDFFESIFMGVYLILEDIVGFAEGDTLNMTDLFLEWLGLDSDTIETIRAYTKDVIATFTKLKENFIIIWDYLAEWWRSSAFMDFFRSGFISIVKGIVWGVVGVIGAIAGAIAGLIIIFAIIFHEIANFSKYIMQVWDETGSLGEFMTVIWEDFKAMFGQLWDDLSIVFSDAWDSFMSIVDEVSSYIGEWIEERIIQPFLSFADMVIDYVVEKIEYVKVLFDQILGYISSAIGKFTDSIAKFFGKKHTMDITSNETVNRTIVTTNDNQSDIYDPMSRFRIDGMRADGGPVLANKNYIVGEDGAELFIPNTSGTIIPNGKAKEFDSNIESKKEQNIDNSKGVVIQFGDINFTMTSQSASEFALDGFESLIQKLKENENSIRIGLGLEPKYG